VAGAADAAADAGSKRLVRGRTHVEKAILR